MAPWRWKRFALWPRHWPVGAACELELLFDGVADTDGVATEGVATEEGMSVWELPAVCEGAAEGMLGEGAAAIGAGLLPPVPKAGAGPGTAKDLKLSAQISGQV